MSDLTVWVDGEFTNMSDAKASLMSHGLHYGTGVFEGIRCYETDKGPAIFRLQDHLDRFAAGTDALGMDVDVQALGTAALELIRKNNQDAAYVRPLSFFELGGLGLDTAPLTPRSLVYNPLEKSPRQRRRGGLKDENGFRKANTCRLRATTQAVRQLRQLNSG